MAALPVLVRLRPEDIPDAPQWFTSSVLPILNRYMESVYYALNGQLDYEDNIRTAIRTFNIFYSESEPFKFLNPLNVSPRGVFMIKAEEVADNFVAINGSPFVEWQYDGESIELTKINDFTIGTEYNITLFIV